MDNTTKSENANVSTNLEKKSHICGLPGCNQPGTKGCSSCLNERYCNAECQKKDWKIHKIMCKIMKRKDELLPLKEAHSIRLKLSKQVELMERTENKLRLLECQYSFCEYQLKDRINDKPFRERHAKDIKHYDIDVGIFCRLSFELGANYVSAANDINGYKKKAIHYFNRCLSVLESWRLEAELVESERMMGLDAAKVNAIYKYLSTAETNLGIN